jgi:hypothetical protein
MAGKRLVVGGYEAATVGELVELLKAVPADTPVLYRCCSDWSALRLDQIKHHSEADKGLVLRTEGVRDAYGENLYGDETPVYLAAVTFPGN